VENNFYCPACTLAFFVPNYSFQIAKGVTIYVNPLSKAFITCPRCGSNHIEAILRPVDLSTIQFAKYGSASMEDKRVMLRKRAKLAMKKDAEQRHEIETKFRGHVNEKHY
jgi:hypothetical protein